MISDPLGPSAPHTDPLVAVGLSKRYRRGRAALSDVSLTVQGGGVTALVGPNGSGKSTLIKLWTGLEMPTAGSAWVLGRQPGRGGRGVLQYLAYVPQSPALYRELTVEDHLALAAHLRPGFDRKLARTHLTRLSIALDRSSRELSGGEAAQVSLAIALGTRAPILLLDEPLASLDPLARTEFLGLLREATRREGSTALLSSHVVRDVEQGCDWLTVLGVGRVLFTGSLETALSGHAVDRPSARLEQGEFVGTLPDGRRLMRMEREAAIGRELATLEDVVLGYLARGRELR